MKRTNQDQKYLVRAASENNSQYARFNHFDGRYELTFDRAAADRLKLDDAKHARHKIQENFPEFDNPEIEAFD